MSYQCPKCQSKVLQVLICVYADLIQHGADEFETEVAGDHEWDDDSAMVCRNCGYGAASVDFERGEV